MAVERRDGHPVLSVLAIACVCLVGLVVLFCAVAMGAITVGLSSCVAAISDDPIGDSRATSAFIADLQANERDLAIFDALRGCMDSLCEVREASAAYSARNGGSAEEPMGMDELRSAVAAGAWPRDPAGYGTTGSHISPQLWVRLAELAQDWLEGETGEEWEVMDLSYPFPNNGPIPIPPKRESGDAVVTRLVCTGGDDEGLVAHVSYYRWDTPAYFESSLDAAREARLERERSRSAWEASGILGDRDFLLDGINLYVWERGEDDPLRDAGEFTALAREAASLNGDYLHVSLVASDTPVVLAYDALSYDYPNDRPYLFMTHDSAQTMLVDEGWAIRVDHASADVLLDMSVDPGSDSYEPRLYGTLSPDFRADWHNPWRAPDEGSAFDEGLAGDVAGLLGIDASRVIATSHDEGDSGVDSTSVWVVLPRGSVPEDPEGFCSVANAMLEAAWGRAEAREGNRKAVYVHVHVIDEQTIRDDSGQACTFVQLRASAQDDPSLLGGYSFDLLLGAMPSATLWPDDDERHDMLVDAGDVDGWVACTREWRYGGSQGSLEGLGKPEISSEGRIDVS